MENNTPIKIADLKILFEIFLSKLNSLDNNQSITPDKDLYWNILDEELYDPYKDPVGLTMGSLTDDWEFLQKVMSGERDMIDYDLYKLAAILRCLGSKEIIAKESSN
ncbi:hypothetical protein [Chryseobacterium sp. 2987]|uniref:hypothetical protein n=1 Tax=Chryseobacterium sp. 2987 TaxID=2817767 RepID=UPI0028660387|nr:hypothetical protein [Chryseobacterium sp. 2987]MDR6922868.1 hypothetical protein [Chryseobacterium sp. 2987]